MNIPELTDEQILDFLMYLEENEMTALDLFSYRAYFTENGKFVALGLPYSGQHLADSYGAILKVKDTPDALRILSKLYHQSVTSVSIPFS